MVRVQNGRLEIVHVRFGTKYQNSLKFHRRNEIPVERIRGSP